jgi:hypothetical protein
MIRRLTIFQFPKLADHCVRCLSTEWSFALELTFRILRSRCLEVQIGVLKRRFESLHVTCKPFFKKSFTLPFRGHLLKNANP